MGAPSVSIIDRLIDGVCTKYYAGDTKLLAIVSMGGAGAGARRSATKTKTKLGATRNKACHVFDFPPHVLVQQVSHHHRSRMIAPGIMQLECYVYVHRHKHTWH